MCGIVGVVVKENIALTSQDLDVFKDALICDSIRGEDSTGVFSINKEGNADWLKLATDPYNLLLSKDYSKWKAEAWRNGLAAIGHNRKATQGEVSNTNAHPFTFGNTILIHNGGLDNWRQLLSWRDRDKNKIEVDSHAACMLLARNEPEKILPQFRGAFAFVWYDVKAKRLNFIRNDERPLHFASAEKSIYFASEPGMLAWLLGRRGIKHTSSSLKPGVMLTLQFGEDKFVTEYKTIQLDGQTATVIPPRNSLIQERVEGDEDEDEHPLPRPMTEMGRAIRRMFSNDKGDVEIPEMDRYNIHYGKNQFVIQGEKPFQQIVFSVEDYKPTNSAKTEWALWGKALDSDSLDVSFNFTGDEKAAETLAYTTHLIGRIRDVTAKKYFNGRLVQEIFVSHVKKVELTTSKNGSPLTVEHFDYIYKTALCDCQQACNNFEKADLLINTNGCNVEIQCSWCEEFERQEREAAAK